MYEKLYDKIMSLSDYDEWYSLIKEILGEDLKRGATILDLGCGTGEITKRFLDDGFNLFGVDMSNEMLSIAESKCKSENIDFVNQDIRYLDLGVTSDVAISLFDTVNYFLSKDDLINFFNSVNKNLKDGGVLLFDAVSENFMEEAFSEGAIVDDRGDLIRIWEHEKEDEIDVIYATYMVEDESGKYVRFDEEYEKMVFTKEEIVKSGEACGFEIVEIKENSELAGSRRFYMFRKVG